MNNWDQAEENLSKLWTRVFQAYKELCRKIHVQRSEELIAEPIFCNDNIQVGKKIVVLLYRKWIDKVCVTDTLELC